MGLTAPLIVQLNTRGKVHEINIARRLPIPKAHIVVIDRGYADYELFDKWTRDLWEWINKPFETLPFAPDAEQLSLRGIGGMDR